MSALLLEQKYKEFTVYSYSALKQFPKSEKHGLAAELREAIWRGYRLIIAAMKRYHKKTTLTDLDIEVTLIKRMIRLALELRYIDFKKFEMIAAYLSEIGKMIGGWIKTADKAAAL